MHHTEYDTRLSAYAVIIDAHERMLLTWYNGSGLGVPAWSLPGGGIEFDETLEEGLRREVHEESGYEVEVGELLHAGTFTVASDPRTGRPFRSVRLLYGARFVGGELGTLEQGGSTDFARWVPIADIPHLEQKRAEVISHALDVAGRVVRWRHA